MQIDHRIRSLLLMLTHGQHLKYDKTLKELDRELKADLRRPFALRHQHQLFVIERVITNKPVNINEVLRSVTPNPLTPKEELG